MHNPDFKNQYTNFFVAYGMGYVGYRLIAQYGIEPLAICFFIISTLCFVYFFKTTISRLRNRIRQGKISIWEGLKQYMQAMSLCVLMMCVMPVVLYLGERFWKLRLF